VNQEQLMHQLRMRPLKLFWGWTKTTSSLPKYIYNFSPLLCPKTFFSYLPTSYLLPTSPLLPCTYPHLPPPLYLRSPLREPEREHQNQSRSGAGTPEPE
jgi:hypothetical protein